MWLWLVYVFLIGEEELLLAWLDGPLGLQPDSCSLAPLQGHKINGLVALVMH